MKKIAIVSAGFGGSTTSLIEAFLKQGHVVDFYYLTSRKNLTVQNETFDLPIKSKLGSIKKIKSMDYNGLRRFQVFVDSKKFEMFQIACTNIYKIDNIKSAINPFSKFILWRLGKKICNRKYNFINVIGQSNAATYISIILKKNNQNIVHSIHEICDNHLTGDKIHDFIPLLIKNDIQLNVFSQKSADDLNRLSENLSPRYSVIPFSLFNGYQEFKNVRIKELSNTDDFVLFFGFIQPYKGLKNLYNSVQLLKKKGFNKKVVIAGNGQDPYLNKIKNDDTFILINRILANDEIVTLLNHCHIVVCPYLSSSQTGITQTVFNFGKPIIATKVPAFTSTIIHEKTGLLVDINDEIQLAEAISITYNNSSLYKQLCKEVESVKNNSDKKWAEIANMYLEKYT